MFSYQRPLITDWSGNVLQNTISYLVDSRSYSGEPLTVVLPGDFLIGRVIFSALGIGAAVYAVLKLIRS